MSAAVEAPASESTGAHSASAHPALIGLTVGALGVVFGDIGTSPLYAFREALQQSAGDGIDPSEILGVLSLALWTLTLIVTVKYVLFLMRADKNPNRKGVQLVAKEGEFATLRLPSTEMRRVLIDCRATVGEVGNSEHELMKIGKAGRNRWKGVRPQTRGVAMNPVDHPLGGGEGRTSGGRPAVSPWGKPEGVRTRNTNKPSQSLIVRRRRTSKGRR